MHSSALGQSQIFPVECESTALGRTYRRVSSPKARESNYESRKSKNEIFQFYESETKAVGSE